MITFEASKWGLITLIRRGDDDHESSNNYFQLLAHHNPLLNRCGIRFTTGYAWNKMGEYRRRK
jgi:hypothetical protein